VKQTFTETSDLSSVIIGTRDVTPVALERIWNWGKGTGPARKWGGTAVPEKNFGRAHPLFAAKSRLQLVVFMSAFVMVSTVWSVSYLLFFYSRCPSCPAICKSGGGHVGASAWHEDLPYYCHPIFW